MNDFSYAYPSGTTTDALAGGSASDALAGVGVAFLVFALVFYALFFVYFIVAYVFQAISLQTIAKRRGISKPWLAWIPFAVNWVLGAIARDHDKRNGINRRWDKVLLTLSIVVGAVGIILEVVLFVSLIWTFFNATGSYTSEEDIAVLIIGMYLLLIPILFLAGVLQMLSHICVFKLFESTVPERTLTYFLIYYLLPLAAPFCLFACRNKGYEIEQTPLAFEPVSIQSTTIVQEDIEQVDTE
ncbi:MAG: hypothetical protein IKJ93_02795 [Clostridia bacterium]|nr:hypothetical protein [Clostridia bacterium]